MAFIPVPGVAQFNVRAQINTIPMENVLHFIKEDEQAWDSSELNVCSLVLRQAWQDYLLDVLSVEYQAMSVYARDLATQFSAISDLAFLPDSFGVVTGDSLPGNVAACITHRTGIGGRSFRGRTYIGGLAESQVTKNTLTGDAATAIMNAWTSFIDVMVTNNYTLVIASRYSNNAPRVTGIYTNVQGSLFRDLTVDTQRRRLH